MGGHGSAGGDKGRLHGAHETGGGEEGEEVQMLAPARPVLFTACKPSLVRAPASPWQREHTNGSSGSSLGCGMSSTSECFPLPHLTVLPWLDREPQDRLVDEAMAGMGHRGLDDGDGA